MWSWIPSRRLSSPEYCFQILPMPFPLISLKEPVLTFAGEGEGPGWSFLQTQISALCVCGGGIIPFQSIFKYQRATVSPYRDDEHSAKDAASLLCFVSLFVVFFSWLGLALDWFEELLELAPEECSFHVEDLRTAGCKITFTFICVAPGGEEEDGSCPALLSEQVLGEG